MQLHHTDDESLVALCVAQSSDKRVLNELIRRYGRLVLQTITWTLQRYTASNKEDIEDFFQEVFTSLFENESAKLKAYDPCKAGLGAYLRCIARSTAINALNKRKKGNVEITENIVDAEDGFIVVDNEEMMGKVRSMLVDFTVQERLFFYLYFEECMPPETIANVMGVTVDSVYSKKAKIIDKIKKGLRHVMTQA
jgi:RNA polymerase sigma-70 factor (ECF subfamily)